MDLCPPVAILLRQIPTYTRVRKTATTSILAIFTGNISKSQYEALRKEINWEGQQAQGQIIHAASFDDSDRIHVADVWESADAMNAYVGQRLMPTFKKLGIAPPEVAVYPVHNLNAYKSIEKYKI